MRLIVLQGLPSSGKTTMANELVKSNPDYFVRASNDDLRTMLGGGERTKKHDPLVKKLIKDIIVETLKARKCVVIDNTNLNQSAIDGLIDIAGYFSIEVEFNVVHPGMTEILKRNSSRENPRPEKMIQKMYNIYKHLLEDTSKHVKHISEIDRKNNGGYQYDWG